MRIDRSPDRPEGVSRDRRGPSRLWLALPLLLALLVVGGWCGWWFLGRSRIEAAIDQAAQAHQAEGRSLGWERRSVAGFPFRYAVRFESLRFASPSGWAVEAPRVEVQANAYQLTRWVAVAPEGLTLVRPQAGPVEIRGREIRASLTAVDQSIPRFALEGVNLTFAPRAGADPFFFTNAQRLEVHLRPAPDRPQDAAFVVRLQQAQPRPGGLIGFVSAGKPGDIVWESVLTRFGSMRGDDWASVMGRWTEAGGRMEVVQASLKAGDVAASTRNAVLSAGIDGRLRGRLELQLNRPAQALAALGQTGQADPGAVGAATAVAQARGANASLPLVFEAGVMTVGPVALGDAPRVY